jgi:ABC-2 type transport system ATP-binding protein
MAEHASSPQRLTHEPITPAIEMIDVTKRFRSRTAVRELNLSIPQGGVVGFVGLNGAGKTTTIRLLLGLLRPSSGQALILGAPFSGGARTDEVGAMVDRPALYAHLNAAQNLELFGRMKGWRGEGLSRHVTGALEDLALGKEARRPVRHLSTGMRQRVGVALAFLGNPSIIILDEPTDGLDPAGVAALRRLVSVRARTGATVLFSSHLLAEVETLADRVVIIHEGVLVADGPQASFRKPSFVRATFETSAITQQALQHLATRGWHSQLESGSTTVLIVDVADSGAVSAALGATGIFPSELSVGAPSLEETLLSLSGSPEERL